MRLRQVVQACTGKAIRAELLKLLPPIAGVNLDGSRVPGTTFISILEHELQTFQSDVLTPRYSLARIGMPQANKGQVIYGTGPEEWLIGRGRRGGSGGRYVKDSKSFYEITSDPLDIAIQLGIIERLDVSVAPSQQVGAVSAYPLNASQLLIKKGTHTGEFIGGPGARLYEKDRTSDPTFPHRLRSWNPLDSLSDGQDPVPLFDACFSLIRRESDILKVRSQLPQRLETALQAAKGTNALSLVSLFDDYIILAQAMGVLAQWARKLPDDAPISVDPIEARFDDVLLPVNSERLFQGLGEIIANDLQPADEYVTIILALFIATLVQLLNKVMSPLNQDDNPLNLRFIDLTLKRLAGYMAMKAIEFVKPTKH
jgi:hypothetical protein